MKRPISKKLRRAILDAVSNGTIQVLDAHCEEQRNGTPPDGWSDLEKRLWDIINEVETRITEQLKSIIGE